MIALTAEPLDPRAVEAAVAWPGAGAVCTFLGIVRDNNLGREVGHLEYEAYPEMALPAMKGIAREVAQRWPGARVAMAHRVGTLAIGEPSVVISVATPHRAAAFEACRYAIDTLKTTVPIWKKEVWADGSAWIEGVAPRPLG
jgi:molybdopterin synthase catalytic subunit